MQTLVDAVRATGATNIVLVAGLHWAQALDGWVANRPTDPLHQLTAVWHAYRGAPFGAAGESQPNFYPEIYDDAENILAAGILIVISEIGDQCSCGTTDSAEVSNVTRWADAHLVSVLGWTWDTWFRGGTCNDVLIKDAESTPTDGFGRVFHDWLVDHR